MEDGHDVGRAVLEAEVEDGHDQFMKNWRNCGSQYHVGVTVVRG